MRPFWTTINAVLFQEKMLYYSNLLEAVLLSQFMVVFSFWVLPYLVDSDTYFNALFIYFVEV